LKAEYDAWAQKNDVIDYNKLKALPAATPTGQGGRRRITD